MPATGTRAYEASGDARAELPGIRELVSICAKTDGSALDLGWDSLPSTTPGTTRLFISRDDQAVIGFLVAFTPDPETIEVAGMVHPAHRRRGVFTDLLATAMVSCRTESTVDTLLTVPSDSPSGKAFSLAMGAVHSRSEYRMGLGSGLPPMARGTTNLTLERMGPGDLGEVLATDARCFGDDRIESHENLYRERLASPGTHVYRAVCHGTVVGQATLLNNGGNPEIVGFGILPGHRGKGLGRAMLEAVVAEARSMSDDTIIIEVDGENTAALGLYASMGFVVLQCIEYHAMAHGYRMGDNAKP